jgi:integrase
MASIQARHRRSCGSGKPWTPFADLDCCDCEPTYYVAVREGRKLHRERVGKNRRAAERALTKIQAKVDEDEYVAQKNIRFRDWGEQWLSSLERKGSTVRAYRQSIGYATEVFGEKFVRKIRPEDVAALNRALRAKVVSPATPTKPERLMSASTRNRHLRTLTTCFNSAIQHRYAVRNPVTDLPRGERPRPEMREAAYFTNAELPVLFDNIAAGVYRVLIEVALKTGMRQGELLALTWANVDLQGAVIRVRQSYTDGELTTTKTQESRDVDITADVVELLGRWWGDCNRPVDDELVFPGGGRAGYIPGSNVVTRQLYAAMAKAGLCSDGEGGHPSSRPDRCPSHFSQLAAHLRQACTRERSADHVAIPPSWPFDAQGDDRHLRALGTRRAEAPSRDHGRCVWGLDNRHKSDARLPYRCSAKANWSPAVWSMTRPKPK